LRGSILTAGGFALLAGCAGGPSFSELFDDSAAGEGTGFQTSALIRAVIILARHSATPRQRQVAEQNAQRAVAKIQRQIAAERAPVVEEPEPKPRQGLPTKPKRRVAKRKTKTRMPDRIAVRTVKDERTAPKADVAVMLYDVRVQRIVGNEVYDVEKEPPPGELVRFDTQVVRYVGVSDY
jgi:hypothetical protein